MKKITKSISVSINEEIDADVTLSLYEIKEFFESCEDNEKRELLLILGGSQPIKMVKESVMDELKIDLLIDSYNKYSLDELETRLK